MYRTKPTKLNPPIEAYQTKYRDAKSTENLSKVQSSQSHCALGHHSNSKDILKMYRVTQKI